MIVRLKLNRSAMKSTGHDHRLRSLSSDVCNVTPGDRREASTGFKAQLGNRTADQLKQQPSTPGLRDRARQSPGQVLPFVHTDEVEISTRHRAYEEGLTAVPCTRSRLAAGQAKLSGSYPHPRIVLHQ